MEVDTSPFKMMHLGLIDGSGTGIAEINACVWMLWEVLHVLDVACFNYRRSIESSGK